MWDCKLCFNLRTHSLELKLKTSRAFISGTKCGHVLVLQCAALCNAGVIFHTIPHNSYTFLDDDCCSVIKESTIKYGICDNFITLT
jgi:hypothetical protein